MSDRVVGFGGGEFYEAITMINATLDNDDLELMVAVTAANTVAAGSADGPVFGRLKAVAPDELSVTVQVKGVFKDVPYAGTAPVLGLGVQFQAAGIVEKGDDYLNNIGRVIKVDTDATTCDFII